MGYARKALICLNETPYYHVISRCVRRAWLWGFDEYAGKDYSHRKTWVLERLQTLSDVFAIDICAYAIMSNHYHLVLHVDRARTRQFSREEVVERWTRVFDLPPLLQRWRDGSADETERTAAEQLIERWRARLSDVSWYMRCLNEHLARRANAEDRCTGRFWEGRFKSQALLEEAGLLTAMTYVDLNPVRAGIAATPEASEFTSIYARVEQVQRMNTAALPLAPSAETATTRLRLFDFRNAVAPDERAIPISFHDYVQLVDWSGRALRSDKRGAIDSQAPDILERLNIDPDVWCMAMGPTRRPWGRALGRVEQLRRHAQALGQPRIKGLRRADALYRSA